MPRNLDEKKAAVLKKPRKVRTPLIAALAAAVLAAAGIYLVTGNGFSPGGSEKAGDRLNSQETIAYPVSDFADGKARYFSFRTPSGLNIRYFIIRSSDGIIRAAFDSCDTCWASGKGYRQEGDFMVCNNCGQRFSSERINEVKGGCNPAPLTRDVKDNRVIVRVSDIVGEGSFYFDFGKRG